MTGREHYQEAERLIDNAREGTDSEWGMRTDLSPEQRLALRNADLLAAVAHAILALSSDRFDPERESEEP